MRRKMKLKECYAVLNLNTDADRNAVKQSYRKLAKKFHPDKNPQNVKWAEKEFHKILEAYKTIVDNSDEKNRGPSLDDSQTEDYWDRVRREEDNAEALTRLMLHEFLKENFGEAVRIYEKLKKKDLKFRLEDFMEREDCIDCEFMIGEEYEQQGDYEKAFFYFERVFESELKSPRMYGYFIEETAGKVYNICYRKIHKEMDEKKAEQFYRRALKFRLNEKERANIFLRLYDVYRKTNRPKEAEQALKMAWNLNPEIRQKRSIAAS